MKGLFTRILLILIFLALAANILVYALKGESLASEQFLYWGLIGAGGIAGIGVNLAGIRYTTKGLKKRTKSSFIWSRRGFVVGLVVVLLVGVDSVTSNPLLGLSMQKAGIILLLLTAGPFFFAIALRREYMRTAAREAAILSGRE